MKLILLMSLGCSSAVLISCAQGNCRSQTNQNPAVSAEAAMKNTSNPQDRVKVFKYDGSLQCGMGKAIPLDDMAKQLKDIQIFSKENKADGLMHIQQCGTPTGRANVYEIDKTKLSEAKKAGFKEWTWD